MAGLPRIPFTPLHLANIMALGEGADVWDAEQLDTLEYINSLAPDAPLAELKPPMQATAKAHARPTPHYTSIMVLVGTGAVCCSDIGHLYKVAKRERTKQTRPYTWDH